MKEWWATPIFYKCPITLGAKLLFLGAYRTDFPRLLSDPAATCMDPENSMGTRLGKPFWRRLYTCGEWRGETTPPYSDSKYLKCRPAPGTPWSPPNTTLRCPHNSTASYMAQSVGVVATPSAHYRHHFSRSHHWWRDFPMPFSIPNNFLKIYKK